MNMNTESKMRFNAAAAARDTLLGKAAKSPDVIIKVLSENPHQIGEFSYTTLYELVQVLLDAGCRDKLLALVDTVRIERWARSMIVEMALFY